MKDLQCPVHVFNRGVSPVAIFERDRALIETRGEGTSARAHNITFGPDDSAFLGDVGDHTIRKFAPDGRLLMTLGTPGGFFAPHGIALDHNGDLYVGEVVVSGDAGRGIIPPGYRSIQKFERLA